ncbi:MAG TPA: hypothetical protein VFJ54_04100 [Actinomycetota bacterium]|nr:hypothetical protein [Actinomycetota bacterium]
MLAYVLVNAFLFAIWAVTSDGTMFRPIFPIPAGASDSHSTRRTCTEALQGRSRSTARWNDVADHLTKQPRSADGRSS